MPVYYGSGTPIAPGAFPALLAVGDSWFWYPLPTGFNLLQQLSERVLKPDYANILSLGYVGATLQDFVEGRFAGEFQEELKPLNAQYYSAVLISGAGNDAVDYSLALKSRCAGIGSPGKCFDEANFDGLMRNLSGWMGSRGCLDIDSDWDNELHPNSQGFEKLATGPWRTALAKYGFA
jgi:hypothetical protein